MITWTKLDDSAYIAVTEEPYRVVGTVCRTEDGWRVHLRGRESSSERWANCEQAKVALRELHSQIDPGRTVRESPDGHMAHCANLQDYENIGKETYTGR